MANPYFQFKQFTVWHDRCAMKVGTDGVLLGAWAPIHNSQFKILDIGTGSGLVALMLAQRYPAAQIDAIDIDEAAVEQARENFAHSAFSHRLSVFRSSLQNWQMANGTLYDLIVSNPPYFQNSLKNPDKGRELARHTDSLSYEELIHNSVRLLNPHGQLALILPAEAEEEIRTLAATHCLYCSRVTRVFSKQSKPARRVLLAFSRSPLSLSPTEDALVLEDEKGGRSAAYQELTKDFYL